MNLWKDELRGRLLGVRRGFGAAARADAGRAIAEAALALPELVHARIVAAYVAHDDEPDTASLLDRLRDRGAVVLLPVVAAGGELEWAAYDGPDSLVPGAFGIPSPPAAAVRRTAAEADVLLVPGVAFDARGWRLGRGRGYYDRALARVREGAVVVGLAYDECVVTEVPVAPHDRRVDVVVTPTRVLRALRGRGAAGHN